VDEDYPELLSLAVHEFRTPASVVGGYLRMLLRDAEHPLSARHLKLVTEAEKSCTRIVELVAELSDIAKLDRGLAARNDEAFDLFAVLEEVAGTVHESREREVHLQLRGDAAGAPVKGDSIRIRVAFASLFRAVLREQAAATRVIAERRLVQKDDTGTAVVVIAREDDVAQAYESAPAAFLEKRGGLGLALPIARRVIELHGGRIWSPAMSGAEGSAIVVSLPLQEPGR
jgi:signal transduction histidine kinase